MVIVVLIGACHEATAPVADPPRYYRLHQYRDYTGLTLPADGGGDFLLDADSSYLLGIRDGSGALVSGRWSRAGTTLTLSPVGSNSVLRGVITDDSAQIPGPVGVGTGGATPVFFFSRATFVPDPMNGSTWVLRSVGGRTADASGGIVEFDTTYAANAGLVTRAVARVSYDTLTFSNRAFVRHTRSESDTVVSVPFGATGTSSGYSAFGGVDPIATGIVIRLYGGSATFQSPDTLLARGDTLVRRVAGPGGPPVREERYVRLR